MAMPGTMHALMVAADARDAAKAKKQRRVVLPKRAKRDVLKRVIPYLDRVLAQAEMIRFAAKKRFSIAVMRAADGSNSATKMRMVTARHLKQRGVTTPIIADLLNRDYDTVRYYIHESHREARRRRYRAKKIVHFVRFEGVHDQRFQNAVMVFGKPDFLHRHWDQRAKREIGRGDMVVFAKGDHRQPVTRFNGDDEAYQ